MRLATRIVATVMTLSASAVAVAREAKEPVPRSFFSRRAAPIRLRLDATAELRRASNPRWVELQFPGRPNPEPQARRYVENITRSVNDVFVPFLRRGRYTFAGFKRALQAQHTVAMLGQGGGPIYGGYYAGQDWKAATEALVSMARRAGETVDADVELALEQRRLSQSAGRFRSSPVTLEMSELLGGRGELHGAAARRFPPVVEVTDIPAKARPRNEVTTEGAVLHRYPDPRYVPLYLASMYRSLDALRACDACTRRTRLELIAEYVHTAANAHLFERVNHSLIMSQMNTLLLAMGTAGMKHAVTASAQRLDALAITMHVDDFKQLFLAELLR